MDKTLTSSIVSKRQAIRASIGLTHWKELPMAVDMAPYAPWYQTIVRDIAMQLGDGAEHPLVVVEAGVRYGCSARIIADALCDRAEWHLYLIDPVSTKEARQVIDAYPGNVSFLQCAGEVSAIQFQDGSVDLLHIDADVNGTHPYEMALGILLAFWYKLKPNASIILHDCTAKFPSIQRLAHELESSGQWIAQRSEPQRECPASAPCRLSRRAPVVKKDGLTIVVPVVKNMFLDSLLSDISRGDYTPTEIIVIDNSCAEVTRETCEEYPILPIRYLPQKTNLGVDASWNLGMHEAKTELVSILNDDLILSETFISSVAKTFETMPLAGFVVPTTTNDKRLIMGEHGPPEVSILPRREGWAFTVRKSAVEPIPSSLFTFFGDDWFFQCVQRKGLWCLKIKNNRIFHHVGISQNMDERKLLDLPTLEDDLSAWNLLQAKFRDQKTKEKTRVITSISSNIPKGWHAEAHRYWLSGNRQEAVQIALKHINTLGPDKPVSVILQIAYYLFLLNDYQSAATILEYYFLRTPDHLELALNLAVCYSRLNRHEDAVRQANVVLAMQADNVVALDILAANLHSLGRLSEASMAGTRALELKDRASGSPEAGWILPEGSPRNYARQDGKRDIIAFSLWGNNPRYLRGAIQNILLAPKFFPAWTLRFYIDDSLPSEFVDLMEKLGAEVIVQHGTHTLRERLCWRLQVANDPSVGHFLVRDVDSVFGNREAQAVNAWLASDLWFHVIRDWWTHSDLILAGMWGGVAGVLPSISAMLANYLPKHLETPNVDQWFLRDKVWAYIRQSCLVHDRCFRMPNSTQLPGPEPSGYNIGQNEFAARHQEQEQFLRPWIEQYPCLGKLSGLPSKSVAIDLYLDLMEKCLTNTIYEDKPMDAWSDPQFDKARRDHGLDWPSQAHTMIGNKRMRNLRQLTEQVLQDNIPGDLIETGIWRGGACILMRAILKAYGITDRIVWCADSFAGLPKPDSDRFPKDAGDQHHTFDQLSISLEQVQENFAKYGLLDNQVRFLKGWFKDTLPGAPIERLAILRLDGDMYQSTMEGLQHLFHKVSPGGYVIVDDYGAVEGCRLAVQDFRRQHGINDPICEIDGIGVYWRKR